MEPLHQNELNQDLLQQAGIGSVSVEMPPKKRPIKIIVAVVVILLALSVVVGLIISSSSNDSDSTNNESSSTITSDEVSGGINMLSTVINMAELNKFNDAVEKYALPSSPLRGADSQYIDITALVGNDVSWGECEISNTDSYPLSENIEDESTIYDVVYINTTCPAASGKKTIEFDIRRAQDSTTWFLYFLALRSVDNV